MRMRKRNTNKHIPMRTCIACREVKRKREMVRLVRNLDGSVKIDTSGKEPGRGAYLCRALECWQDGLAGGRLEYVLKTKLTQENREQLIKYGKTLIGGC
jgi:predicted RNA-binding protein YlxR (DUF448 family)